MPGGIENGPPVRQGYRLRRRPASRRMIDAPPDWSEYWRSVRCELPYARRGARASAGGQRTGMDKCNGFRDLWVGGRVKSRRRSRRTGVEWRPRTGAGERGSSRIRSASLSWPAAAGMGSVRAGDAEELGVGEGDGGTGRKAGEVVRYVDLLGGASMPKAMGRPSGSWLHPPYPARRRIATSPERASVRDLHGTRGPDPATLEGDGPSRPPPAARRHPQRPRRRRLPRGRRPADPLADAPPFGRADPDPGLDRGRLARLGLRQVIDLRWPEELELAPNAFRAARPSATRASRSWPTTRPARRPRRDVPPRARRARATARRGGPRAAQRQRGSRGHRMRRGQGPDRRDDRAAARPGGRPARRHRRGLRALGHHFATPGRAHRAATTGGAGASSSTARPSSSRAPSSTSTGITAARGRCSGARGWTSRAGRARRRCSPSRPCPTPGRPRIGASLHLTSPTPPRWCSASRPGCRTCPLDARGRAAELLDPTLGRGRASGCGWGRDRQRRDHGTVKRVEPPKLAGDRRQRRAADDQRADAAGRAGPDGDAGDPGAGDRRPAVARVHRPGGGAPDPGRAAGALERLRALLDAEPGLTALARDGTRHATATGRLADARAPEPCQAAG